MFIEALLCLQVIKWARRVAWLVDFMIIDVRNWSSWTWSCKTQNLSTWRRKNWKIFELNFKISFLFCDFSCYVFLFMPLFLYVYIFATRLKFQITITCKIIDYSYFSVCSCFVSFWKVPNLVLWYSAGTKLLNFYNLMSHYSDLLSPTYLASLYLSSF